MDFIIGADILFWPDAIEPLTITLKNHFTRNPKLEVYIAIRERATNIENLFDKFLG